MMLLGKVCIAALLFTSQGQLEKVCCPVAPQKAWVNQRTCWGPLQEPCLAMAHRLAQVQSWCHQAAQIQPAYF